MLNHPTPHLTTTTPHHTVALHAVCDKHSHSRMRMRTLCVCVCACLCSPSDDDSEARDAWFYNSPQPFDFHHTTPQWYINTSARIAHALPHIISQTVPRPQLLVDVVIPLHPKDIGIADKCVELLRRHCGGVGDVYVVGPTMHRLPQDTIWVSYRVHAAQPRTAQCSETHNAPLYRATPLTVSH